MTAQLHIVSGKGGTGKTTVAAALALALAHDGRRVLLVEVEGRGGISQVFDVAPLGDEETHVARGLEGGEVRGLAIDPKAALLEYLQMFYKLGRAGGLLEKFGAIDFATTIAPGMRDVLVIGKVYEVVRRDEHHARRGFQQYDAVVVDAPPTGRIGKFLAVNRELSGLAKMGPIKKQADSIMQMLTSGRSRVHLVAVAEEMPVQETIDATAELRAEGLPMGSIIVNQERAALLGKRSRALLQGADFDVEPLSADLAAGGLRVGPTLVDGLVESGRRLDERLSLEERERARLTSLDLPIVRLPALLDGMDAGGLRQLAADLHRQGV
ncbi:ArsA-related P-loop ATPase [Allobranchiibius sp. GilTou38]|uniref:ArsA-related P-loop ATPase n=1 Tax=Allobranchiibius sp. GilTou38 TaxID=2815210 RepID=UPI001AA0B492|nr:ArsA family ATPase [Allobranchiibius sp. GilTou38]